MSTWSPRLAPSLLALPLALAGCHSESVDANFTAIRVLAYFDGQLPVDELAVSGTLADGRLAFEPGTIPIAAVSPPPARREGSAVIRLPAELAGQHAHVVVDAKSAGVVLISGAADVVLALGQAATASISLGVAATCGDGRRSGAEVCDDGNTTAGDGCSADCEVEGGFVCAESPSRCFDASTTVFTDPGATCPGDGSSAHPFCRLAAAVQAQRVAAVVARRGLYAETVVLDHLRLELAAEDGAVLESSTAPALHVRGGSIVTVFGLGVRGAAGTAGGGVLVEGAGTTAELRHVAVGPSTTTGVVARDGGTLVLLRSRVEGNRAGGVELDSDAPYGLENDVIMTNGSTTAAFGGLAIRRAPASSRLVNLTVAANVSASSTVAAPLGAAGIGCAVDAQLANTIVWANLGAPPVSGRCHASYSDLGPFATPPGDLGTSFSRDPALTSDGHLDPASPCVDRGDPTGVRPAGVAPADDYDGDLRPLGRGVDVGADEVK